ncbi:MAG: leucine-rich repeat protein [Clostridia bacterium]|nr:leucine-rich repeat protein [Clostridia bacterium]
MKKILSVTLVLTILLGTVCIFPVSSWGEDPGINSGDYFYTVLDDGTASITTYTGTEDKISIPSELDGYKVSTIGNRAFLSNKATEVIIPDTVTCIDTAAFRFMRNLTKITIPKSVTTIELSAFEYCESLSEITFPENIEFIGRNVLNQTAFAENPENWENGMLYVGTYLVSSDKDFSGMCTVKDGTTLIAEEAFKDRTEITEINLPKSLKYIGKRSFEGCKKVKSVVLPEGVVSVGECAFLYCSELESINLPQSVKSVGDIALMDTKIYNNPDNWQDGIFALDNVILYTDSEFSGEYKIKEGIRIIADEAFAGQKEITSIIMPDSVEYIGKDAFGACYSLENIKFSENLIEISEWAFTDCISLSDISIPASVTAIHRYAFTDCRSLSSVVIPETVTEINPKALAYRNPNDITPIPDFIIYGIKGSAGEVYANENGIKFVEHTEKYRENVFDKNGYYLEVYEHFSTSDESTPDFVLISAFDSWDSTSKYTEVFGDYILHTNIKKLPDGMFGYYIYLPDENKAYTLSDAYKAGVPGVYDLFTECKIGILRGDVNNDRKLNIKDATDIQKHLVGTEYLPNNFKENEYTILIADFNGDGKVNIRDATAIQKRLAKMDKVNLEHKVVGIYSVAPTNYDHYPEAKAVAKTKEELESILSRLPCETSEANIDATFDEAYFEEHNVIVISDFVGSSCCKYLINNLKLNGSTLTVTTMSNVHGECVPDVYCQCTLIEVDKEFTNNIATIDLVNTEVIIC